MKKIRNKFIYFVVLLVITIVASSFIKPLLFAKKPESAILLIQGAGLLNQKALDLEMREILKVGDVIETLTSDSLAVIEWADGSLTRMGGNSKIEINENNFATDGSHMQIAFELFSGKTWSNVVSFLGEESYFRQTFRDNEAGVRGTVFNVDLENDYIYVADHAVEITTAEGELYTIKENQPFSLQTFSFIDLTKFINQIKDKAWEELNNKFDQQYLKKLQADLISRLEKNNPLNTFQEIYVSTHPEGLNLEKKKEVYNQLLSQYQDFNIVDIQSEELFRIKQNMREALLEYATQDEKVNILSNTIYDFEEGLETKNTTALATMAPAMISHKEVLSAMNIDLSQGFNFLPEELKDIFGDNMNELLDIFKGKIEFMDVQNYDANSIKDAAIGVKDAAKDSIHKSLDSFFKK